MDLTVATRPGRGCLVVQVSGDLDLATVPQLRSRLQQALDESTRVVVLDFTDVPLIDSTALGMIVWLHNQLVERGGHACVAAPQPVVLMVLELTMLDRLIQIYDSVKAAEDDLTATGNG